jgi:hypothetical protein
MSLSEKEKQELREMAASESLREEFRAMRRNLRGDRASHHG